jgi:glycosyltransferase involved in cell wall biosynthesis
VLSNLNGRAVGYSSAMARAARELGIRYVYRVAGNDIEARAQAAAAAGKPILGTPLYEGLLRQSRLALALADRVIVMSRKEARRVAAECPDPERVAVCFRGVDQRHFRPAPRLGPCRRFLFVGRRGYEKGYDILEAAAERLREAAPQVEVAFAGNFAAGVAGNRRYLGFVGYAELPALYRAADALVLCSRSEGFPQVIMEAMSCGLPCIVTRELFRHDFSDGEDCLLVEAEAEAVSRAMLRLAGDDTFYRSLSRNAAALARRSFCDVANNAAYCRLLLDA